MNEKEVVNGQDARPGGVINRPAASRARVVCHTGVNLPSLGIPSAGAARPPCHAARSASGPYHFDCDGRGRSNKKGKRK